MTVRTRFAPSPTGYMHIGGMRTALFNWVFARHHGGQFVLRIDDTDQQRNLESALGPILSAFRWLGLEWDEGPEVGGPHGPYFQSQRTGLYQSAMETLFASGQAYRCFDSPEQIAEDREKAQAEKVPYLNVRRSLDFSDSEIEAKLERGAEPVIRFLVPRDRKVAFTDAIRGDVEFDCGLIPDPVIMRANGSPLYNFATVVDDSSMNISHVIRAEEHLSNTPVQHLIYEALGKTVPVFAHIPYVAAPGTKEKLSKRKLDKYRNNPRFRKMFEAADRVFPRIGLGDREGLDPVMVEYYEKIGYLPDAVFNALSRVGWSLDDKTEVMSRETVIESFSLDRVVKSPAGLDPDKLDHFQAHWMGELSSGQRAQGCLLFLQKSGLVSDASSPGTLDLIERTIELLGDRLVLFSDILSADYFFKDELSKDDFDLKNLKKRMGKGNVAELVAQFCDVLEAFEEWNADILEAALAEFCERTDVGVGKMIPALRVGTTGVANGPDFYPTLEILGKDRCLKRLKYALEQLPSLQE